jgi:methylated-DNA-[protein]-cysteine S-methyltransferase
MGPHRELEPIYIGLLPASPIGPLWVAVSTLGLIVVEWAMSRAEFTRLLQRRLPADVIYDENRTAQPIHQISEYLSGNRHHFDLPLDLTRLSPFQKHVLQLTIKIPFGRTISYKELASQMGKPYAARAVGRAEATNPIPLVIPCHRVVGSDGNLHGYGGPGGIKLKAWLLELERNAVK